MGQVGENEKIDSLFSSTFSFFSLFLFSKNERGMTRK
jgi:hypothetical protein